MRTKEDYAKFLESAFWKKLSLQKRRMIGHCERCSSRKRLQAHHRRYPEDWYDTTLEDLEVLCRWCHEKEHGITPASKPVPVASPGLVPPFATFKDLCRARSMQVITREVFMLERARMKHGAKRKKHRARSGLKRGRSKAKAKTPTLLGRGLNFHQGKRWVNRGSSSN